ncbi:MAG: polysaccharide biosynthesis/export family protein [Sphingobium sp.]
MVSRYIAPILAAIMMLIASPLTQAQAQTQTKSAEDYPEPTLGQSMTRDAAAAEAAKEGQARRSGGPIEGEVQTVEPTRPQGFDYSNNLDSDVFGANLFTGAFAHQESAQFNPDYVITIGDRILIRLWGAFEFQSALVVDPQGNIFLPNVGPVHLVGVRNKDLQSVVNQAVGRVFRSNVLSYASLAAAQPVRIYVGGFVHRPGSYAGTSMDSILHYLDQAGGIDPERGSFLSIEVKRGNAVRARINLYDFLLNGEIPQVQLGDGDVIFVNARKDMVKVTGLAENAKRFEFAGDSRPLSYFVTLARPTPDATHVRVTRNQGTIRNVEYYPLAQAGEIFIQDGDELAFTADKRPGTISVRVEGETESPQEYVLPYGSRLGDLLSQVHYSARSVPENIQLFRKSVQRRQKELLDASLQSLESSALNARSGTNEEASLRKQEAELILQWVERARKIEPKGQVVISQSTNRNDLLLENGDVLHVPVHDGLVLVSGEVLFPNAVAFDRKLSIGDYIQRAGGYTNKANSARIIVARQDGSFAHTQANARKMNFGGRVSPIEPGDEILVLPKVDVKSRQIFKEITQIVYQIAIGAGVALGL